MLALASVQNDPQPWVARELLGEELVQLGVRGRHDDEVPERCRPVRGGVLPDADPELVEKRLASCAAWMSTTWSNARRTNGIRHTGVFPALPFGGLAMAG